MSLCLAIATRKEYRALLSPLGAPAVPPDGQPVSWKRGGREMSLLLTGVGPVAAAATLGRHIGAGHVTGVVCLGVAGSYDLSQAPLGTPVVANAEVFPEYGLRREDGIEPQALGFPQLTVGGEAVYDRLDLDPRHAAAAMGLCLPTELRQGAFATVSGVTTGVKPHGRDGLLAENMEGFALALACRLAGIPFLELRTISNKVGARPPRDWDLSGALTALAGITARLLA